MIDWWAIDEARVAEAEAAIVATLAAGPIDCAALWRALPGNATYRAYLRLRELGRLAMGWRVPDDWAVDDGVAGDGAPVRTVALA